MLEILEIPRFRNISSSSAGAIIAGMLAVGASADYITDTFMNLDFEKFIQSSSSFSYLQGTVVAGLWNLRTIKGWCDGNDFLQWYSNIIESLCGDANITLAGVHKRYGGRLVITTVALHPKRGIVYMDWRTHGHVPLVLAVRMSMSIPGLFQPAEFEGQKYIDGGVLDNYPIKAFHRNTLLSDSITPNTIGVLLMTSKEIKRNYKPVDSAQGYISAILDCYMNQTQAITLDKRDWDRTIKVNCRSTNSFDFGISISEKTELLTDGANAVLDYFLGRSPPAPVVDGGWDPSDEAVSV
jgi:predicted acylesterase/phospholipase RssA